MDKKVVLEEFYNQIKAFLTEYGFKLNKSKSVAKRNTKQGFDSLFFDVNDMIDNYSITTALRIRNNIIQEIRGEINPRYKNRKETSTVLEKVFSVLDRFDRTELDYEVENPGNLINEKNLSSYLLAFKKFMMEVGFSFFESFKSIEDFDKWFNAPILDGTYDFRKGSPLNSSVSGLIAAKLSANPRYEEIYSKWIAGISPKAKETLKELEETKRYLDKKL